MTEINDKAQLDITAAGDTDAVTSDTPEETVNTPEVDETFELSAAKMREHGMSETAINQFRHLYDVWRHEEASSWIREDDIEPLGHVPSFHDVYETINHDKAVDAFAKTAFLKLNGGLGTSMGWTRPSRCCRCVGTRPSRCASSTSSSVRCLPLVHA